MKQPRAGVPVSSAAHIRRDDAHAFLPDPFDPHSPVASHRVNAHEDLADTLAEEFVASATSAGEVAEDTRDAMTPQEIGGPFVETSAQEEFAGGVDEMNPPDAEREPFPRANGGGSG